MGETQDSPSQFVVLQKLNEINSKLKSIATIDVQLKLSRILLITLTVSFIFGIVFLLQILQQPIYIEKIESEPLQKSQTQENATNSDDPYLLFYDNYFNAEYPILLHQLHSRRFFMLQYFHRSTSIVVQNLFTRQVLK